MGPMKPVEIPMSSSPLYQILRTVHIGTRQNWAGSEVQFSSVNAFSRMKQVEHTHNNKIAKLHKNRITNKAL